MSNGKKKTLGRTIVKLGSGSDSDGGSPVGSLVKWGGLTAGGYLLGKKLIEETSSESQGDRNIERLKALDKNIERIPSMSEQEMKQDIADQEYAIKYSTLPRLRSQGSKDTVERAEKLWSKYQKNKEKLSIKKRLRQLKQSRKLMLQLENKNKEAINQFNQILDNAFQATKEATIDVPYKTGQAVSRTISGNHKAVVLKQLQNSSYSNELPRFRKTAPIIGSAQNIGSLRGCAETYVAKSNRIRQVSRFQSMGVALEQVDLTMLDLQSSIEPVDIWTVNVDIRPLPSFKPVWHIMSEPIDSVSPNEMKRLTRERPDISLLMFMSYIAVSSNDIREKSKRITFKDHIWSNILGYDVDYSKAKDVGNKMRRLGEPVNISRGKI